MLQIHGFSYAWWTKDLLKSSLHLSLVILVFVNHRILVRQHKLGYLMLIRMCSKLYTLE